MSAENEYQIAEELHLSGGSEERYRAAASRAYFAAFGRVMERAMAMGFAPTHKGEDHKLLIAFLKCRSVGDPWRRVGYNLLPRLRGLRNYADYEKKRAFTKLMSEESLEIAYEIIFCLE